MFAAKLVDDQEIKMLYDRREFERACEALARAYRPGILSVVRTRRVRQPLDPWISDEDVVQAVLVSAHRYLAAPERLTDPVRTLAGLLQRITVNQMCHFRSTQVAELPEVPPDKYEIEAGKVVQIERKRRVCAAMDCIDGLPNPKHRNALTRVLQGQTFEEIGILMGYQNHNGAYSAYMVAGRLLTACLESKGVETSALRRLFGVKDAALEPHYNQRRVSA